MTLTRRTNLAGWLFLLGIWCGLFPVVIDADAQGDRTDPLGGARWSPDSEWVALNWPERPGFVRHFAEDRRELHVAAGR